jgi:hypothetical protein
VATVVGAGVAGDTVTVGSGGGVDSGVGSGMGVGVEVSRDSALGGSGDAASMARTSSEGAGVAIGEVADVLGVPQPEASELSKATRATRIVVRLPPGTAVKASPVEWFGLC